MSYQTDANKKIIKIKDDSSRHFIQLQNNISNSSWWESKAKDALEDKYKILERDLNSQLKQLLSLNALYSSLQRKVEQAIEEKKASVIKKGKTVR